MTSINPDFIEKYQILYQKDPKSKIFAPLAEAYRKMGMQKEALAVAKKGVEIHPNFPSGRVALAKILLDNNNHQEACEHLRKAIELSPENILAHSLLAKSYMEVRKPKKALAVYKMLLFLNPDNKIAQNAVKKLESLSADEFDDDVFSMKPLHEMKKRPQIIEEKLEQKPTTKKEEQRFLERSISLADAYLVRNDLEKAKSSLLAAKEKMGEHPEIAKRLTMISARDTTSEEESQNHLTKKIAILERLLLRIERNEIKL